MTLADVAEVSAGNPAPQGSGDFCADGKPFVRMQDVGRQHHTRTLSDTVDRIAPATVSRDQLRLYPAGTLLIPKSGASVNLNHRALLGVDAYVVSHLATVVPNRRIIDPEYLYYWSLTYDPRHQAQTTSLPSLPTSLIKAAEVPVPPIAEQCRVVELLSRAENIVRMRREAEAKTKEIIPALFMKMFGESARQQEGWRTARLEEVTFFQEGPGILAKDFRDAGTPLVRLAGLKNEGKVSLAGCNYLDPATVERKWAHFKLVEGDILVLTSATFGSPAVVGPEAAGAVFYTGIIRFRPTIEELTPAYLKAFLGSPLFLMQAQSLAAGAVIRHFGPSHLRQMNVPIPPMRLQEAFSKQIPIAESLLHQQVIAVNHATLAFGSLLADVFGGNLQG